MQTIQEPLFFNIQWSSVKIFFSISNWNPVNRPPLPLVPSIYLYWVGFDFTKDPVRQNKQVSQKAFCRPLPLPSPLQFTYKNLIKSRSWAKSSMLDKEGKREGEVSHKYDM